MKIQALKKLDTSKIDLSNVWVDVGTSGDGMHAANWLALEENPFVIGVEPNTKNIQDLQKGVWPNIPSGVKYLCSNKQEVHLDGKYHSSYREDNFVLIEAAIDDVKDQVQKAKFYCTSELNTGCSSLLQPTDKLEVPVKSVENVDVCSLEYVFDSLFGDKLNLIRFVKTDTQGNDFNVIKSLGKYLNRVIGIQCEWNTFDCYRDSKEDPYDLVHYMVHHGFKLVIADDSDMFFLNKNIKIEVSENRAENVFLLPTGFGPLGNKFVNIEDLKLI